MLTLWRRRPLPGLLLAAAMTGWAGREAAAMLELRWETDPESDAVRGARAAASAELLQARRAGAEVTVHAALADLNNDRRPELFSILEHERFCPGGRCEMRLHRTEGSRFTRVNTWPVGRVAILHSVTRGWQDIRVDEVLYRWNGSAYAP